MSECESECESESRTLHISLFEYGAQWRNTCVQIGPSGEEVYVNNWDCDRIVVHCGERDFASKPIQDSVADIREHFGIEVVRDESVENAEIPLVGEVTVSEGDVPYGWIMYWLTKPIDDHLYCGFITSIYDSTTFAFDLSGSDVTIRSMYRFAAADEKPANVTWSTDVPDREETLDSSPCIRLPRSKDYVDIPTLIGRILSDRKVHIFFPKEKWAFYETKVLGQTDQTDQTDQTEEEGEPYVEIG